ncbi:hypothetical protein Bca4012_017737 [Brassica carinata]
MSEYFSPFDVHSTQDTRYALSLVFQPYETFGRKASIYTFLSHPKRSFLCNDMDGTMGGSLREKDPSSVWIWN